MSTSSALAPTAPGLSQAERVVDSFIAPSKTFADILRSASCWLPILLLILATLTTGFIVDRQVGFERVYENQMQLSPKTAERMDQIPPEQKGAAVARIKWVASCPRSNVSLTLSQRVRSDKGSRLYPSHKVRPSGSGPRRQGWEASSSHRRRD